MSDTSILTAIKYKGKMIGIPQDSSVSWNDLTDKPVVRDTSTQTVLRYYDIASYQPIRNLKQRGYGWGDNSPYDGGGALYVDKESITNAINALSSQLTGDQKNIWRIEFVENGDNGWEIEATIDINNEEVLYFYGDLGITLRSEVLDYDSTYWKILVNDSRSLLDDNIDVTVDVIPVNFITRDGQTVTSLTYTETITVPGEWYFDPDHVKKDASVGILWDTSMNGGSVDLSDYYTKTQIDTSIANNYASKSDVSALDSSVSWNDLTDKPTTKTFLGYDVYENNINADFPAAVITPTDNSGMLYVNLKKSIFTFIVNPSTTYYNGTYTDKDGNTQTLSDWQKQFVTIVCYKNGVYRTKMIIKLKSDYTYEMILFESLDVKISSIDVHTYSGPENGSGSTELRITFTFNSQDYNYSAIYQEITDGYWKVVATDKVYSEKFLPSVIDTSNLVSKSELYDLSTGIVNNYYTKTQIDTSIANNYASKSSVTKIDTSVSQLWDTSTQGSGISIKYLTQAEYNALHTKDPNTLYLIEVSV